MADASASERRRAIRVVPAEPVSVAIETETNLTHGVVCTDAALGLGEDVLLRLSIARQQPLPASGRVVWKAGNGTGTRRYGIQWTHAGPPRLRLEVLIGTLR
jgi:Tfp pilus assembly protein PilZ